MINGLILDIDGVLVGEKIGYNSPYPHPDVTKRLKAIQNSGVNVSLCTAKPHYAIRKIIEDADLRSVHITDGGAVIIDPLDGLVAKKHLISNEIVKNIVKAYLKAGIYTEVYTLDEYLIDVGQQSTLTETHTHILQCQPRLVSPLPDYIDGLDITKIMPVVVDEDGKANAIEVFKSFADKLTLNWGVHRIALPHQFGIITAQGISKAQATLEIAAHSNISPDNLLGVGDSTSDWDFIKECGYAATLENGSDELKELVTSKEDHSFIGGHVDANGILEIFDNFGI